jgi:hypothetical protein
MRSLKEKMMNRYLSPLQKLYWIVVPHDVVVVKWPDPFDWEREPYRNMGDPNNHYRAWLEENLGEQGYNWDWHLDWSQVKLDKIYILVPYHKRTFTSLIGLMWG